MDRREGKKKKGCLEKRKRKRIQQRRKKRKRKEKGLLKIMTTIFKNPLQYP
jgi:hypothetical protein